MNNPGEFDALTPTRTPQASFRILAIIPATTIAALKKRLKLEVRNVSLIRDPSDGSHVAAHGLQSQQARLDGIRIGDSCHRRGHGTSDEVVYPLTALPITSASRFSPLGPLGIVLILTHEPIKLLRGHAA